MEPSKISEKVSLPTAKVVAVVLCVDYFSIQTMGMSPAFLNVNEVAFNLPLGIGYFAVIVSLVLLPLLLPLFAVSTLANFFCAQILLYPIRKSRLLKAALKFHLRQSYIRSETVRRYAHQKNDGDLLKKLNDKEKAFSAPMIIFPFLTFVALNLVVFSSDSQSPNFMMRVCSSSAPVVHCSLYSWLLTFAYFQIFLIMALQGLGLKMLKWFPKADLDVDPSLVLRTNNSPDSNGKLFGAMKTWMGRSNTENPAS